MEHCGIVDSKHDGLCLTSLISYSVPADTQLPKVNDSNFQWISLTDQDLVTEMHKRLSGYIVPLSLS